MRAAILQCDAADLDAEGRLDLLRATLADHSGLDVLVCPELFASGYHIGDRIAVCAEPRHGVFAQGAQAIARESGTAILYGYPEAADSLIYNAASLIGPEGPIAHHRKLAIPPGPETGIFQAGTGLEPFDFKGLRCTILICYDAEFPEAVRAAALAGAEVVFVPTALGAPWPHVAEKVMPTRAFENGLWLLYANHAGQEEGLAYLGGSRIIGPDGFEVAVAGAEPETITATLTQQAVTKARARLPYLSDLESLRRGLPG